MNQRALARGQEPLRDAIWSDLRKLRGPEFVPQIIFAIQRAECALQAQADALLERHDYDAQFPAEDAERMREAISLLSAVDLSTAEQIQATAESLVKAARSAGFVLTIEQHSTWPLAMGAYNTEVLVRESRSRYSARAE